MRHSVNIMFGKQTGECLLALHKYMLHSGSEAVMNFYRSYLYYVDNEQINVTSVDVDTNEFAEALKWSMAEMQQELPLLIRTIHQQMITIHNRGDYANLHLCLYVPLLEDVSQVTSFISAIEKGGFNYVDIDVICLAGDLCTAISQNYTDNLTLHDVQQKTSSGLKCLVEYRKKHQILQHLIAIQNYQNGGVSLSFQQPSLVRLLGEFSLLMIENYMSVFGNQYVEKNLQTMGMSILQLDKFYFTEYLLRKTLKTVAEKEHVKQDRVDINNASKYANDLVKPWLTLLSETYRKEIKVALDRHEPETNIISNIDVYLVGQFEKMREELEAYMRDETLSLPEKKAILSSILGADDSLLINDLYDEDLVNFHDLEKETMEHFITTNNYILKHDEHVAGAKLSDNAEDAYYPVEDMRKNRIRLRRVMGYIRDLSKEQEALEQQMDLKQKAIAYSIDNDGFTFGSQKYKLLPHVEEISLQEQYVAHPTSQTSVDLSNMMSPVKNQGGQGACMAFSLTSVFEYLYKRKTQQDIDLSEQFLYYTARDKAGETDKDAGSYLNYALESLAEFGLCREEKWKYGTPQTAYNICPTADAYKDALERKLVGAQQVALNADDIRSALSDGYPVVISVQLFDSFGTGSLGYVSLPTEEERSQSDSNVNRNHAMVICGYNDEINAFKVRNSWGSGFGFGGYVFMPYAYITDSNLTNYAVILTDVALAETIEQVVLNKPINQKTLPCLEFDKNDTRIQYSINKMLLNKAQLELEQLKSVDKRLSTYCLEMKQKLKNPTIRQQMCKAAEECYNEDLSAKQCEVRQAIDNKLDYKDDTARAERRIFIKYGLIAVLLSVFFFITLGIDNKYNNRIKSYSEQIQKVTNNNDTQTIDNLNPAVRADIFKMQSQIATYQMICGIMKWCHKWWIVLLVYIITISAFLFEYVPFWKEKRQKLKEYDDIIDLLSNEEQLIKKQLAELKIKFHLAGVILTQLFTINDLLEKKSIILDSFLKHIISWADENEKLLQQLSPTVQAPFIQMLTNEDLDKYFLQHVDEITNTIHLFEFVEGYTISEEVFDTLTKTLKEKVSLIAEHVLESFSIYKYMSGTEHYDYLTTTEKQISSLLKDLDHKSEVFMLCNDTSSISHIDKYLYIHVRPDEEQKWQSTYKRAFSTQPAMVNIESPFKIILLQLIELNLQQIEWYK